MNTRTSRVWIGMFALLLASPAVLAWAGPYSNLVTGDDPVAYWRLNQTSTSQTAVNAATGGSSVGSAANGTYTSGVGMAAPGLIAGDTDTAISFADNSAERMLTAGFEKFAGGTGFSVEFWTKLSTIPNGFRNMVGDGTGPFDMMVYAGNQGFIRPHLYTSTGYSSLDSVQKLQAAQIVHVVSTWDATTGYLNLYLNGKLAQTTVSAGTNPRTGALAYTANPVYVGRDDRGVGAPGGVVDEVAVYKRPLASTEIAGHYLVGAVGGPLTLPVSYWSFDESASGTGTAYDLTDGNNSVSLNTATRTSGLIGAGAALFNHAGAGVDVGAGTGNNFSFTTGITVEALIKPDSTLGSQMHEEIFRKEDGNNRILFSIQNFGTILSLGLNVGGTYGELDMPLDGLAGRPTLAYFKDGNAHHVLGMYDSLSGEKAIWVDGSKVYSTVLSGLLTSGGGASAYIGSNGGGEPFAGVIDEVAIYGAALRSWEIGLHYGNFLSGQAYFTTPEPSVLAMLLGLGGIGLLGCLWRRRRG